MGKHSFPTVDPTSRSGRFRQRTQPGVTAFWLYVFPLLLLTGGIVVGMFGVSALQAALGHGTPGYFIAQSYGCGPHNQCGWSGEFELADGTVIGTDFSYQGADPAMSAGTTVPALDPSGSLDTAFPRQWNWDWVIPMVIALIGCAGSVVWFWAALKTRPRRTFTTST